MTFDSAQTDYPHVTHQLKAQQLLIVCKMVLVLWSVYERSQSYGCFTTVGVKKMPKPIAVPKLNSGTVKDLTKQNCDKK